MAATDDELLRAFLSGYASGYANAYLGAGLPAPTVVGIANDATRQVRHTIDVDPLARTSILDGLRHGHHGRVDVVPLIKEPDSHDH